jgi:hypothetical protein
MPARAVSIGFAWIENCRIREVTKGTRLHPGIHSDSMMRSGLDSSMTEALPSIVISHQQNLGWRFNALSVTFQTRQLVGIVPLAGSGVS